jgi:hypothetical protein
MLTDSDRAQMAGDLLEVREDNPASLAIRRGESSLLAQSVRIARLSGGGQRQSLGGKESRAGVVVLGAVSLDIQVGDRFTYGGILYRVNFIRPNRTAATMAECEAVE